MAMNSSYRPETVNLTQKVHYFDLCDLDLCQTTLRLVPGRYFYQLPYTQLKITLIRHREQGQKCVTAIQPASQPAGRLQS